MTIQVGMEGAAIMTEAGDYVFVPEADPYPGETGAAVAVSDGTFFMVAFGEAAEVQTSDVVQALPEIDGFFAIADRIQALPQTITAGVTQKTASSGYTEILRNFIFFWNGSTPVYLSAASTALKPLIVDDTLIIETPRGTYTQGANPVYNNYITLSDQGILKTGVNSITVTLKNSYGSQVSTEEVYLLTGEGLDVIDNTMYYLPLQITTGVTTATVSQGYTETLGTFKFYWNGSGSIWISGAYTPAYIATNDTLILTSQINSYTVGADPQIDLMYDVTSIFAAGLNTVTVTLKNTYGTTIGSSALYLIQN